MARKLILAVIDGLTPGALELALEGDRTPALRLLADHGRYSRAVSTFPSLTPVCLSTIATGSPARPASPADFSHATGACPGCALRVRKWGTPDLRWDL